MATKKKSLLSNWQENYASFILGAIIVVILGLLVANFITQRNQSQIDEALRDEQVKQEQEAQEQSQGGDYKVVAGDSLSKIAEAKYGDKMLWPVIASANKITNPNVIHADTTLKLPSKEEASKINEDLTRTTYEVADGDTLFIISQKVYGNGGRWMEIAKANNVGHLPNGNPLIFAGSTLRIPR